MISVYPSTEKEFTNNGIKILKPLKAIVRKEDNGDFYLDLKDTIENIDYYQSGLIIRAPTPWGNQLFRITNPKTDNNRITVKAKHVYFDTKNYIIVDSNVVDKNCNDALDHLNKACDKETPFTFLSDVKGNNSYRCVRKNLETAISEVIDRWGGHLVRDNYKIEIRNKIGRDNGIVISVGKNLQNLAKNEVWDDVVTKILPVGKDGLTLPEIWVELKEKLYDIPYTKVIPIDQSNIIEDDYKINDILDEAAYNNALINDLRNKALIYLEKNKLPKVNYSVEAYLKDVSDVGDVIYVKHPKCRVDLKTNVIAIEYDCILNRYIKIEFGNFKNNLKNLLSNVTSKVTDEVNKSAGDTLSKFEKELSSSTNKILKLMGDSYVIYDGDKILIVDKLPKEEAKNVIIINNGGIGFSKNGIDGPFNSAWTIDGTLNMQTINVINFVADLIKGGTLKLGGEDNNNGVVEIYNSKGELIGKIDNNGFSYRLDGDNFLNIDATINEIKQSLSKTINLVDFRSGSGKIDMVSSIETTAVELKIRNACQSFPNNKEFTNKTTFPKGSYLRVTYEDNTYNRYRLPPLSLRNLNGVYDEMNIKSGKISVTTRIGKDENDDLYILDKEVVTTYNDISILIKKGRNILKLESFPETLFDMTYMLDNIFSANFATAAEVQALIEIAVGQVMISVDSKAGTTEVKSLIAAAVGAVLLQVNKEIEETNDTTSKLADNINKAQTSFTKAVEEINKEMGTKIGDDEYTGAQILLKINNDESGVLINADKLNLVANNILKILAGNTIDIEANDIIFKSKIFELTSTGQMTFKDEATSIDSTSYLKFISANSDKQYTYHNSFGSRYSYENNGKRKSVGVSNQDIDLFYSNGVSFGEILLTPDIDTSADKAPGITLSDGMSHTSNQTKVTSKFVSSPTITQTSRASKKKNFEKLGDALDIVNETAIYKYHLKSQKDCEKKHIGFVIGRSFNYSKELTDENNEEVDLYSMISVAYRAIQQQQEMIKKLETRVKALESKV